MKLLKKCKKESATQKVLQVVSKVGASNSVVKEIYRQKGIDVVTERETIVEKNWKSLSSRLKPLPTMVNEERKLVEARDDENSISEISIIELLSNSLSRCSPDIDENVDKEKESKGDKSSTPNKERFTNVQKKPLITSHRSILKMKSSGSSLHFKNKQATKVSCTSCLQKHEKVNKLEATILKMEVEIGRLSSAIDNGDCVGKFNIASNFSSDFSNQTAFHPI